MLMLMLMLMMMIVVVVPSSGNWQQSSDVDGDLASPNNSSHNNCHF